MVSSFKSIIFFKTRVFWLLHSSFFPWQQKPQRKEHLRITLPLLQLAQQLLPLVSTSPAVFKQLRPARELLALRRGTRPNEFHTCSAARSNSDRPSVSYDNICQMLLNCLITAIERLSSVICRLLHCCECTSASYVRPYWFCLGKWCFHALWCSRRMHHHLSHMFGKQ